ncbi:hypothetical protein BGX28_001656 [Mortierella sp. GBA30]|nr:hypothetical protein BGX28_001656 [Mortierella sp. GBA30]
MSYNGAMIRSASSNSSSSGDATGITAVVGAGVQSRHGSRRGSRHLGGGSQSVLGDINSKLNNINNNHNNSIPPTANSAFALNGVVSFSGSPTSAAYPHNHSNNHLHTRTYTDASSVSGPAVPSSPQEHQQESSPWPTTSPPATMSKFDQYKAQMERYRSTRASSTSLSSSSGRGVISATTTQAQVQTQVPPFTSSFSRTNSASSSPDSNLAKTPGSCLPRIFRKTKSNSSKARQAPRDDCSSAHSRAAQPQPQPQGSGTQQMAPQETLPTSSPGSSSSRSSLLNEKETHSSSFSNRQPSSRLDPEKSLPSGYLNTGSGATSSQHHQQQLSPIKEQQDRWRDEWLRPSGAMHSLFRDRPSKFNCPHCGAIKVVSHIQFVPGVMSYLVAFGLLFLTLGTLSYLPFRKDHEGTKDCIHWCPECGQKVARFNRANTTWEWI